MKATYKFSCKGRHKYPKGFKGYWDQTFYFLLLTDADASIIDKLLDKFKEDSKKREIIKNVWVLTLVRKSCVSVNELMDIFSDYYHGKSMIIKMDTGIDAGWILNKSDSEFVEKII